MRTFNIILISSFILLITSCSKEDTSSSLPAGSISFQLAAGKDTIEMPVSILKDSAIVIGLKAALAGSVSSGNHWVSFAVDTSKITDFRARYGAGLVMPTTSYLFYKPMTQIAAGATVSDSAMLNIGQQTKLLESSTYVLPVVISSVDGKIDGTATNRVVYLVFKTGKSLFASKVGWTITAFTSQSAAANAPTNLLDDNNSTTTWATSTTQAMPQSVTINFNRDITFTEVYYYFPTSVVYPTAGGYPTSIQIETSTNGTTWVNKGIFAGNLVKVGTAPAVGILNVGLNTSRYLRFTSLASVKYVAGTVQYDLIFVSGISLVQ